MNKFESEAIITIENLLGEKIIIGNFIYDTSDFMSVNRGDIIMLSGDKLLITGNEIERGFGLDGEPKFWVKRAIDLKSKEEKIVKLVYFERFQQKLGDLSVEFYRSPQKESAVLELVKDHPDFMHGYTIIDEQQNEIRVIERIFGISLNNLINEISGDYEDYFYNYLPEILNKLHSSFIALEFLHQSGLVHGDVRWDHVLVDNISGKYRWIDFDYTYYFPENPFGMDLFGLGNVLADVIGKGTISYYDLKHNKKFSGYTNNLLEEDFSLIEKYRLMNLKKVYPVIPEKMNQILLYFSGHTSIYYDSISELSSDLFEVISGLGK